VSRKRTELPPEQLKPPRLVTGRDLIDAGYKPGPEFSVVLDEIEDAQLEGRIATREEGLLVARERFAGFATIRS
jgi:poly(A) polymerase